MDAPKPQKVVPIRPDLDLRDPITKLYEDHVNYVTRTVASILGNQDVEDVVQHTFVIAIEKIAGLKKKNSAKFWLAGIAINLCRRKLRKRALLNRLGIRRIGEFEEPESNDDTENRVLLSQLYRMVSTLPANDRIAWTLRIIEEQDYPTIALMCDCSVSTAKRRVSNAQTRLKRLIDG